MRLIKNWRSIAARSHSMWAIWLGIAVLVAPEVLFWAASIDTNPRIWFWLGLALLIYGAVGRVLDQGIDHDTTRSPAWVGLIVLAVLIGAVIMGDHRGAELRIAGPDRGDLVPSAPSGDVSAMPAPDAVFLARAVPFVGRWEGLRLQAYRDIVGVWTVCYGETKGVKPGDAYTKAECEAMLAREILSYRVGLHRYFNEAALSTRLPVGRDVAFVSLAYNVGTAGAGRSTAVRRLNGGDVPGACEALTWWNKAGGRVLRGLVNRRSEEREMCLEGVA